MAARLVSLPSSSPWPGIVVSLFAAFAAVVVGTAVAIDPLAGITVLAAFCYVPVVLVNLPLGIALWLPIIFLAQLSLPVPAGAAAGILVILAWVGTFRAREESARPFLEANRWLLGLIGLLLVWLSLSAVWASDLGLVGAQIWRWYAAGLLVVIVGTTITTERNVWLVAGAFVAGAVLSLIFGLAGPDPPVADSPGGRLYGGSGDPNYSAAGFLAGIILAAGLLGATRRRDVRLPAAAAILALAGGLAATQSRGAAVGAAVAAIAALVLYEGRRRQVLIVIGAALSSIALIFALWPAGWDRVTGFDEPQPRSELWLVASRIVSDHPLTGVGLNNFTAESPGPRARAGGPELRRGDRRSAPGRPQHPAPAGGGHWAARSGPVPADRPVVPAGGPARRETLRLPGRGSAGRVRTRDGGRDHRDAGGLLLPLQRVGPADLVPVRPRADSALDRHPGAAAGGVIHVHALISELGFGGAETLVVDLASVASSADIELSVGFLSAGPNRQSADRLKELGIEPVPLPFRRLAGVSDHRAIRRHLASVKPDIVHTHLRTADVVGGLAARTLRLPLVSTLHGFDWEADGWPTGARARAGTALVMTARRRLHRRLIAPSEALRRGYLARTGDAADHVVTIHSGSAAAARPGAGREVRAELKVPEDEFVIVMVSALHPLKEHELAIEAVARLGERGIRLVILGDGQEGERLRGLAARRAPATIFTGYHEDVMAVLDAADLLLHPSRMEGFPIALLEAMAAGVPILATGVGGIPEVVEDGTTGVLLEPRPSPDRLAEAIAALHDDPARRAGLAERARLRFEERFTAALWAQRMRSFYAAELA